VSTSPTPALTASVPYHSGRPPRSFSVFTFNST
jgi:hypothetical protein